MKKYITLIILVLSFCSNANASIITMSLSEQTVTPSDTIEVQLWASEFEEFDAFMFDLTISSTLFEYQESSFGSDLFISNPFSFFEVNQYTEYLSFSFVDLTPVSNSYFLLASFNIIAKSVGIDNLTLENTAFYQPYPATQALNISTEGNASVHVTNVAKVSEPATWLMFILGSWFLRKNIINHNQF
ncbi:hypothetical protein [Colwellia sp. 20A7]|uniref:hypothetical protein n=1 Tax=Colwellia sp. 20A7 TaxID=2689569 RepID=UPI00135817D5|nr:hypothetical protein [Colwellia sp. 20A7]